MEYLGHPLCHPWRPEKDSTTCFTSGTLKPQCHSSHRDRGHRRGSCLLKLKVEHCPQTQHYKTAAQRAHNRMGLADTTAQTQLIPSPQKHFLLSKLDFEGSLPPHPWTEPDQLQPQVPPSQSQRALRQDLPSPQPAMPTNHTWEAWRVPGDTPGAACFTIHVSQSPELRL